MFDGLIVDNFAGGGGASTGIEAALGRPIDIAINHDAEAVAMHAANHPDTLHYCQSVWSVDPLDVVRAGGPGGRHAGIDGVEYAIADIGMRMLSARELFRAQGFPDDYIIDVDMGNGRTLPKTAQTRMCGNSVAPPLPEALVRANLPELCLALGVAA